MVEPLELRIAPAAIADLPLSSLNGTNGFFIVGAPSGAQLGSLMSGVGDINGDGFADFSIASSASSARGVVFGKPDGFAVQFDIKTLNGTNGFLASAGTPVGIGDVDSDGLGDLAILSSSGITLVFGKRNGFGPNLDPTLLSPGEVLTISGTGLSSVRSAGDVNGDGADDIVVGAAVSTGMSPGAAFVIFGASDRTIIATDISTLNGSNGFRMNGAGSEGAGITVDGAGDVNGDGYHDVVIGTAGSFTNAMTGAAYLVFGKAAGFSPAMDLSALNGVSGFQIAGSSGNNRLGRWVSSAGDVNGDGFGDIIVSALNYAAVVLGKATGFGALIKPNELTGSNGFVLSSSDFSPSQIQVSNAGDVNGDGFDDIVLGAPESNVFDGATYVVFGRSTFSANMVVVTSRGTTVLDGVNGFRILAGAATSAAFGAAVRGAGDVNGDGYDDFLIGSSTTSSSSGGTVIFGFDNGAVTHQGTGIDDTLTGTAGANVMIGGRGNDLLHGAGGGDVLRGGQGDDRLGVGDLTFKRIRGGLGTDTLVIEGNAGLSLDLSTRADNLIGGIERIDLSGPGNHTLTLNQHEVFALSDESNTLVVLRNAGDVVNLGPGWTEQPSEVIGNQAFIVFKQGAATVKINAPSVDIAKVTDGGEGATSQAKFRVTQANVTIQDTVIAYTVSGAGVSGEDFIALSGTVTIPAGQTVADIDVAVLDDQIVERTEDLTLTLSAITAGDSTLAIGIRTATILINDNDVATITIAKIADAAETTTPLPGRFRVTQSLLSSTDTEVHYLLSGTATAGADYANPGGTVTIKAGETSADVEVLPNGDALVEATETVGILLSGFGAHNSGVTLGAALSATLDISDVDTATVTITKISDGTENGLNGKGVFRIMQSLASTSDTVVRYSIGGSATATSDFVQPTGSVTITAGQTSVDLEVSIVDDNLVEQVESLSATLVTLGAHDAEISLGDNKVATLDIADNDTATVTVQRINDPIEGVSASSGNFRIVQSLASATDTVIQYSTGGTALSQVDYSALSGSAIIPAGQTFVEVDLIPTDDLLVEAGESVVLTLTALGEHDSEIALGSQTNATLTIADNDAATAAVTKINDAAEGGLSGIGRFQVTLTLPSSTDTELLYMVVGGAVAGVDYSAVTGLVVIKAGETIANVDIAPVDDGLVEQTETVGLTLTQFGSHDAEISLGTATTATLDVADNDSATVSIQALAAGGETVPPRSGLFRVTQSLPSATDTVMTLFLDGTAVAGADYNAASGLVTIPAGQTTADIEISILDDNVVEESETLGVRLNAFIARDEDITLGTNQALIEITDNDRAFVTLAKVSDGIDSDQPVDGKFRIAVSAPSATETIVTYSIGGSAVAGLDYVALSGTATIPAGQTGADIHIALLHDGIVEQNETVEVTLNSFGAHDADITFGTATSEQIQVTDNDQAFVTLTKLTDGLESDPSVNGKFRVVLSAASATDTIVTYTIGGTAAAGSDYVAVSGTVTIPAGQTGADIHVAVLDDRFIEQTESVEVALNGFGTHDPDVTFGTPVKEQIQITDTDKITEFVTLRGKHRATFTDADSDLVTIKVSKGTLQVENFTLLSAGTGAQLALVDFLNDPRFEGGKLRISAKRGSESSSDGLVNVGQIDARGVDLKQILVKGDLGRVDAGRDSGSGTAVRVLHVGSLGKMGMETQLGDASFISNLNGSLKSLRVDTDLRSAAVRVEGSIGKVRIGGDVTDGALRSNGNIGSLRIGGDLRGSVDNVAIISARGFASAGLASGQPMAIGSLSIGGSIIRSAIVSGYDLSGAAVNSSASIGSVNVGADWTASNLIAGVVSGPDEVFGTNDDAVIGGSSVAAKIAAIVIKGSVSGTADPGDHFGIVAGELDRLSVAGAHLPLQRGSANDLAGTALGANADFIAREVT